MSVVSQSVQDGCDCSVYEHTAVYIFFSTDNLQLLDCSVTWSLLTLIDTVWTCWLTVEQTDSNSCHTIHRLYTAYNKYTAACYCWWVNQLQPQQPSYDNVMHKIDATYQETAQSKQLWQSDADLKGFLFNKLKIINIIGGLASYVLFHISTSEIIMSWKSV